jgi:hypothetical protein
MVETWSKSGNGYFMTSAAVAFDTVPSTNHLGLLGKQVDLKRTADFLALSKQDVATAARVSKQSVRYDDKAPADVRERLMQIATVCELVAQHFGGDAARTALWFTVPNPLLGNVAPRDMIRLGRYQKVFRLVQEARQAEQRARSR